MKYNAILFDFDGTLTESGLGITRSAAYAFERLNLPVPSQEDLDTFIGPPLITSFMKYGNMDMDGGVRATAIFRERYHKIGWQENRVYAGIAPMLKALKERGVYLAIASAKPQHLVDMISDYFDIAKYFDKIVGASFETTHADKIDLLRAALPEDYDPAHTAMVGDRLFDMEAGKQLGVTSIGVLYGYGPREELEKSGADVIAETVDDLYRILLPGEEKPRGRFITFEGGDGCGKSTQMKKLAEYLDKRGYELVITREPGGCEISERIRDVVLDSKLKGMGSQCEALLMAASRAEHVRQVILPAVENGKIVLCDRFLDSSFAYQARGRELGDDFIRQINAPASVISPDRTLLFMGDVNVSLDRLRSRVGDHPDRIEVEEEAFFLRVHRGFEEIHLAEPDRVHKIDSDRGIDEIFADVRDDINALLND